MTVLEKISHQRPLWVVLIVADIFLSIGGFVGGISFISDKSGSGLQAELSWLEKSPVNDFFLPGIYILVMYALMPIISLLLYRVWDARALVINALVGLSLIPWVVYQFFVVPETIFVQYVMIAVGLIIGAASLLLYYSHRTESQS